jgi:hypothetical protein
MGGCRLGDRLYNRAEAQDLRGPFAGDPDSHVSPQLGGQQRRGYDVSHVYVLQLFLTGRRHPILGSMVAKSTNPVAGEGESAGPLVLAGPNGPNSSCPDLSHQHTHQVDERRRLAQRRGDVLCNDQSYVEPLALALDVLCGMGYQIGHVWVLAHRRKLPVSHLDTKIQEICYLPDDFFPHHAGRHATKHNVFQSFHDPRIISFLQRRRDFCFLSVFNGEGPAA